jgi:PKHD-type hydroxylase
MNKLYAVFPKALSVDKCGDIIRRGMELPPQNASIGFTEDRVDNNYRVSTIRWFYEPANKDISSLVMQYALFANREHFGFDISFGAHEFQFTEYQGSNSGKYDWHHDVFWENTRPHDRKLSVVIQLNDPSTYTGGNFEFRMPHNPIDLLQFRQQGSVLVFPSFFEHRVTPVTQGTRFSLVSWIDGPKFR